MQSVKTAGLSLVVGSVLVNQQPLGGSMWKSNQTKLSSSFGKKNLNGLPHRRNCWRHWQLFMSLVGFKLLILASPFRGL